MESLIEITQRMLKNIESAENAIHENNDKTDGVILKIIASRKSTTHSNIVASFLARNKNKKVTHACINESLRRLLKKRMIQTADYDYYIYGKKPSKRNRSRVKK